MQSQRSPVEAVVPGQPCRSGPPEQVAGELPAVPEGDRRAGGHAGPGRAAAALGHAGGHGARAGSAAAVGTCVCAYGRARVGVCVCSSA